MTVITSRFWDGIEYDDDDFAEVFFTALGNFVIPGKINPIRGDELRISTSVTAGNVTIQPGAALVNGTYYQTDAAVEVTLTAGLGFHLVVLRRDSATNQVRYAIISSTASPPAIPRPVDETDLPLGLVRGQTGVAVPLADIRDMRQFFQMGFQREVGHYENLFHNSEFYGQSGGTNVAPDRWILVNTPGVTYVNSNDRGKLVSISDVNAGEGIRTVVPIGFNQTDNTVFTFTCTHTSVANDGVLNIYEIVEGGAGETLIKTVNLWRSSSSVPIVERVNINNGYRALIFEFLTKNAATTDTFYIGNMGLFYGHIAVDPRWFEELIWYDYACTDASWNYSPYSTANNTIDLTASFANCFAVGAKGVVATITCRDSASAAAASDATAVMVYHVDQTPGTDTPLMVVSCAGLTNDALTSKVVWIPLDPGSTTPSFILRTVASGAGTLDVLVELIGIIT